MTNEAEFRETLADMMDDVEFPVSGLTELASHLPNGPATRFEIDDETVSAMELAGTIGDHAEFPYEDLEPALDDVVEAVQTEGYL